MMKQYNIPEIKITYFETSETMTNPFGILAPESVINILDTDEKKVQMGSINFETLE